MAIALAAATSLVLAVPPKCPKMNADTLARLHANPNLELVGTHYLYRMKTNQAFWALLKAIKERDDTVKTSFETILEPPYSATADPHHCYYQIRFEGKASMGCLGTLEFLSIANSDTRCPELSTGMLPDVYSGEFVVASNRYTYRLLWERDDPKWMASVTSSGMGASISFLDTYGTGRNYRDPWRRHRCDYRYSPRHDAKDHEMRLFSLIEEGRVDELPVPDPDTYAGPWGSGTVVPPY